MAKTIRNVCLTGHSGHGKTTLAEAMLYLTKAISRFGKITEGNTTLDYDKEEIKRGFLFLRLLLLLTGKMQRSISLTPPGISISMEKLPRVSA